MTPVVLPGGLRIRRIDAELDGEVVQRAAELRKKAKAYDPEPETAVR